MSEPEGKEWRTFEQTVGEFLRSLNPKAKVLNDVRTPDVDTGRLRQRDVWIETTFGGHLRITILVSCKRKKAKLSQQDIDAFIGELRSSAANKGVLYAFSGFTKPALEKAEKLGISCCTLLVDAPPTPPEMLSFEMYCFREQFQVVVTGAQEPVWHLLPALFESETIADGESTTVLEALAKRYSRARDTPAQHVSGTVRPTWQAEVEVPAEGDRPRLTLGLRSCWAVFQSRYEGWRLSGSYSFTDAKFAGSFSTPVIDQWSPHPGPGWDKIEPEAVRPSGSLMEVYFQGGDVKGGIRGMYADWTMSDPASQDR